MKIQNRKFTAGDLARFYGVSGDTIRFYDRKGVLSAKQKEKNDYRIYSRADLISMDHILKLKQGGVPLNDISRIINKFSAEESLHYFRERKNILREEVELLQYQLNLNQVFISTLERIQKMGQHITVEMCPFMLLKNLSGGVIQARQWMEKYSLHGRCVLAAYTENDFMANALEFGRDETFLSDCTDVFYATRIDEDDAARLESVLEPGDRIWPAQLCIRAVLKSGAPEDASFQDVERIRNFIEMHNFRLKEGSLCWIIHTENNQMGSYDYYDTWFPIK